jgi:hypothetical protein
MRAGMIRVHPREVSRQDRGAGFVEQVDKRKGHVAIVAREFRLDSVQHGVMPLGPRKGQCELAQRFQPPFADNPVGLLTDRAKHALDRPLVAQQGAVGKGVIGLLGVSRALQDEQKSAVPGRLALLIDRFETSLDVVPDLGPQLARRHGNGARVLVAQCRPVGVVVEEMDVRPPTEPHLKFRCQQQSKCDLKPIWPVFRRAERRCGPVMDPQQAGHLTVAHEYVFIGLWYF